jgi:hypothetical protein
VQAEPVIIHQKFTCGAVHGLNITVHNTAASIIVKVTRRIIELLQQRVILRAAD